MDGPWASLFALFQELTKQTTEHKSHGKKDEVSKIVYMEQTPEQKNAKVCIGVVLVLA